MNIFLANSTKRIFPSYNGDNIEYKDVYVAKNESFNYQVSVYNDSSEILDITINVISNNKTLTRLASLIPLIGHSTQVPVEELDGVNQIPGLVPDPLIETNKASIPPYSNKTFWVKVFTSSNSTKGLNTDKIEITTVQKIVEGSNIDIKGETENKETIIKEVNYYIADVEIAKKHSLPCLHWFYADSISDWYKLELFSDEFWAMCKKYMLNYAEHGNNIIYLPLFTPPLDGIKKPTQLLKVNKLGENKYSFDYTNVTKWVKLAKECGIKKFECVHLFTQWGIQHPIRIYADPTKGIVGDGSLELQDKDNFIIDPSISATDPVYKEFLTQFFASFKAYTEEKGIYNDILYHISDEPHGEEHLKKYKAARNMLREIAPDMKFMDALSEKSIAIEAGVDMPIPSIETAMEFVEDKIPHGVYFCCGPRGRYINRFLDTPLNKTRMLGVAMYKHGALMFLHWGYNYYYYSQTRDLVDPYTETAGGQYPCWAGGDTFIVYPGENGPIDSLRQEVFYEGLQDYDLLNNLSISKNIDGLKDITSYCDFPRNIDYIFDLRKEILEKYC